ncbi:MAG: hypothetical protein E6J90_43345 [Deltaproteobacteria bacterium]|nr:MAG: hypothetical protein E6J90_43345 [Deltaproteobacteria bacterium]
MVLASRADVARVAGCTALGGLALRSGAALDVSQLRALATVTGDLVIGPTIAIEEISLNGLRSVSGAIRVAGNGLLQGLYLPALERAGAIEIAGNAAIITISLPRLQAVRGALHITDNASLEMIDLSSLSSIDQDVAIAGDPRLHLLEAGQLERAAAVRLDAPMLAPDIADRLRATAALR